MKNSKGISRTLVAAVLIIVVVMASVGTYAVVTYPRTILSFSFTAGIDFKREQFDVPFLDSWAQLRIDVTNGTTLWMVRIQSGNTTYLEQPAGQIGKTTYTSDWIQLDSGRYNLTMITIGFGSLEANVKVISKGGFW